MDLLSYKGLNLFPKLNNHEVVVVAGRSDYAIDIPIKSTNIPSPNCCKMVSRHNITCLTAIAMYLKHISIFDI